MNKLSEAYRLDDYHMAIEENMSCCICGEEFEPEEIAVPITAGIRGQFVTEAHLGCAINNNEIEFDSVPSL